MPSADNSMATAVARVVAEMAADGEASYTTVNKLAVSVDYDDLYDVSLNPADSWKLANAFAVSGPGTQFTATLSGSADLQEVLARKLAEATCTAQGIAHVPANEGKNLHDAIYDEMEYTFSLLTNAIPDILEEATHSNTVDWAGGAQDLASKLDVSECEIIAQQLPEANYALYSDASGANFVGCLPVKDQDTLVFVFNVSESTVTRQDSKTPGQRSDVATGVTNLAPAYGVGSQSVSYASNSRKIAFRVKVSNAAGDSGRLDAPQ